MFKKFQVKTSVSGRSQVKTSVARNIKKQIVSLYPQLESEMDILFPKKAPFVVVKCENHIQLVLVQSEVLFWNHRNGDWLPHLRILHRYPDLLPKVGCDTGAIRHILKGVNIFCPGLTNPGGNLDEDIEEGKFVAIMAENKQFACAIGLMKMSTDQIKEQNKGTGVDTLHYLNDGLWQSKDDWEM
eukprot:gb/GEZN01018792.1/.p1 GENE.gb/GEZN01018792.1/~~gb/GEZN01018792.1/.p1  ORF type:complete len:185 (+),score=13.63 gb/GEZN01018792.1/:118-672(+)